MRRPTALAFALVLAVPAAAETLLSEATGNSAGASQQGFTFRAQLTQNRDAARLTIWRPGFRKHPDRPERPCHPARA